MISLDELEDLVAHAADEIVLWDTEDGEHDDGFFWVCKAQELAIQLLKFYGRA